MVQRVDEVYLGAQDRKTWTARTTNWRQMGHSFILLPHLVQVIMWPHSSRTQSIGKSIQILHRFSSTEREPPPVPRSTDWIYNEKQLNIPTKLRAANHHEMFLTIPFYLINLSKIVCHNCEKKTKVTWSNGRIWSWNTEDHVLDVFLETHWRDQT